jgi:hypothetical protein
MKTYVVQASYVAYCEVTIEAEDEDDAYQQALNMDGGQFDSRGYGDWSIDGVMECDNCKEM